MAWWQLVLVGVLVLLPFALMADFHPHRERLDATGSPLPRSWRVARARRVTADQKGQGPLPLG